jgi:hypothetical protein
MEKDMKIIKLLALIIFPEKIHFDDREEAKIVLPNSKNYESVKEYNIKGTKA